MSNLGDYQRVVQLAKKVGGPRALAAMVAGGGFVVGGVVAVAGTLGLDKISKGAKRKKRATSDATGELFDVTSDGEENGGLKLRAGDKYRILAQDGDSVLIEVLNNTNNPHFVSLGFLQSVSDFKNISDADD